MSDDSAALKVLSVVGAGRSGTTVLASILGEVPGLASAGELRWLWERGVRRGRPCGCGESPTQCPVWSPVIAETLAALGSQQTRSPESVVTVEALIDAQHEIARRPRQPSVLVGAGNRHRSWDALQLVRTATETACRSFAAATGAHVVVDTSKRPLDAAVLAGVSDIEHYVLHIVRDPRAVVHSWRRSKSFTTGETTWTMGRRGLASSVRRWTANALYAEMLKRRIPVERWLHLRYEDFARQPRATVMDILAFVGEETHRTPFTDDRTVLLTGNHIVAGNPSRFTTGAVTIRPDEEWREKMPLRDQRAVGLMTLPLRWRYGYVEAGRAGR